MMIAILCIIVRILTNINSYSLLRCIFILSSCNFLDINQKIFHQYRNVQLINMRKNRITRCVETMRLLNCTTLLLTQTYAVCTVLIKSPKFSRCISEILTYRIMLLHTSHTLHIYTYIYTICIYIYIL